MIIFLADIGNTRIKWRLERNGEFIDQGAHRHDEVAEFAETVRSLIKPERMVASNVAGEKGEQALAPATALWQLTPEWIGATKNACGVTNNYDTPEQLGPDRWAAMIAAHAMHLGECLILSFGTAMIIDWLRADGVYAGGLILPGKRLMHDALAAGTSRIGHQTGRLAGFSSNTADAVESGLAYALTGAAQRARQDVMDRCGVVPTCLIAGGDAEWIAPLLGFPVEFVPDLVLRGLALLASEEK
jgi:type III pantothenate kinase